MRRPFLAALTAVMFLTACGGFRESRWNPFNWFGRSQPEQAQTFAIGTPEDPRPLVDQVLSMEVEQTNGGAIIRATGLPPTQGYFKADLVARPIDENGVLVFDFRIAPPAEQKRAGSERSRQVVAATFLSNRKLEEISQIVVQGAGNARSARR